MDTSTMDIKLIRFSVLDLVTNYMIDLLEKRHIRTATFDDIFEFGELLAKVARLERCEVKFDSMPIDFRVFREETKDIFKLRGNEIICKSEVGSKVLRERFRVKVTPDFLKVFNKVSEMLI